MFTTAEVHDDPFRVLGIVKCPRETGDHDSSSPQLVVRWQSVRGEEGHGAVTLRLDGELDAYSVTEVGEACNRFLDGFDRVRINLHAVSFLDGAGTRFLENCVARIERRGGDCCLCDPSPMVRRLFSILGLDAPIGSDSLQCTGASTMEDVG